ncbi:hypothetical protein GCM10027347_54770 [Larkinella harenae]
MAPGIKASKERIDGNEFVKFAKILDFYVVAMLDEIGQKGGVFRFHQDVFVSLFH